MTTDDLYEKYKEADRELGGALTGLATVVELTLGSFRQIAEWSRKVEDARTARDQALRDYTSRDLYRPIDATEQIDTVDGAL